jgi:hypothetical protein
MRRLALGIELWLPEKLPPKTPVCGDAACVASTWRSQTSPPEGRNKNALSLNRNHPENAAPWDSAAKTLCFCCWHCRLLSAGHAGKFDSVGFSKKQRAAQPPQKSRNLPKTKSLTEKTKTKKPRKPTYNSPKWLNVESSSIEDTKVHEDSK